MTRRRSLLFVDRSTETLDLLLMFFEGAGFLVNGFAPDERTATETVVQRIAASDPDVVVYDVGYPYPGVFERLMNVTCDPRVRCPFVFTTTVPTLVPPMLARVTDAPVIAKPYELNTLVAAIRSALQRGTWAPPRPPVEERRRRTDRH